MTVGELIDALSKFPNLQAEVKVRLGWQLDGVKHYTREVVDGGADEPVIGISYGIDEPERDLPTPDGSYR